MRTKRAAIAFAFGGQTGVRMIWIPSLRMTVSKSRVNLVSRSRSKKRTGLDRSSSVSELPGLQGDPDAARSLRAAGEMHPPAAKLDEEQHIEPLQPPSRP